MSYILDALKRSDEERNSSRVPNLQSQPERLGGPAAGARTSARKYVLPSLLLVLLAGIVMGAAFKSTIIRGDIPATPASVAAPAANPPAYVVEPADESDGIERSQSLPAYNEVSLDELKDVQLDIAPAVGPEVPESEDPGTQPQDSVADLTEDRVTESLPPQVAPEVEPQAEKSAASVETDATSDPYEGIPHQRQLAFDIRRELPDMNISVHVYSGKPGSRLVRIDDTVYREGDFISGDLKLEEITQNGLIMSIGDTRFWRHAR